MSIHERDHFFAELGYERVSDCQRACEEDLRREYVANIVESVGSLELVRDDESAASASESEDQRFDQELSKSYVHVSVLNKIISQIVKTSLEAIVSARVGCRPKSEFVKTDYNISKRSENAENCDFRTCENDQEESQYSNQIKIENENEDEQGENVNETESDLRSHGSYHDDYDNYDDPDPEPYCSGYREYDGNMETQPKKNKDVYRDFHNEPVFVGKKQSRQHHSLRTSENYEDELLCRNAKFYCNDELVCETDRFGNPEIKQNGQGYGMKEFEKEMTARLNNSSDSESLSQSSSEGSAYQNDERPGATTDTDYMKDCAKLEDAAFGKFNDLPVIQEEEDGEGPKSMQVEMSQEALAMQQKLEDARKARDGEELTSLVYDAEVADLSEMIDLEWYE